ncbi:hypothetical protein ACFS5M_14070 [Lacinutrix iliipiscaria]|uniref:Uncharacterized protein n=1 Tax=Lacinutrix iliipiscaria TaxID=1230532 RepID=A0ABW5WRE3_9FLAO
MTTQANNKNKSNSFKISEQVKSILHNRGLSKVFNYNDYNYFKELCKSAFNKAQAIADKFTEEHEQESELNEYIF